MTIHAQLHSCQWLELLAEVMRTDLWYRMKEGLIAQEGCREVF